MSIMLLIEIIIGVFAGYCCAYFISMKLMQLTPEEVVLKRLEIMKEDLAKWTDSEGGIYDMKEIYRTYNDTEVVSLATSIECPYCNIEWRELDMDECGETYTIICENCGKKFQMHFDAS